MNILINAYACAPNWGSEQGMAWHWITELAKMHNLYVITEGEWKKEIEEAVALLDVKDNIHFYYNPVSDKIRSMCWNQGDWRFYWYYRKWQKKTLTIARQICSEHRIDIIHQLNMVGFREPGYLWKIKGIPYIIGPVGGMELTPTRFLRNLSLAIRCKIFIKNGINRWQRSYSPRVRAALNRADYIIAATKGCLDFIQRHYHKDNVVLINETGTSLEPTHNNARDFDHPGLSLLWVGKFAERKLLNMALDTMAILADNDIRLSVVGTGNKQEEAYYHHYADQLGLGNRVKWLGKIPNAQIPQVMQQADLLFFTSIMEATSTVVLEAITHNLPILCFDTCGFGSIVKDNVGIAIAMTSYEQAVDTFAQNIRMLLNDKNAICAYSQACDNCKLYLSWNHKAEVTTQIYNQVLANYHSGKVQTTKN